MGVYRASLHSVGMPAGCDSTGTNNFLICCRMCVYYELKTE